MRGVVGKVKGIANHLIMRLGGGFQHQGDKLSTGKPHRTIQIGPQSSQVTTPAVARLMAQVPCSLHWSQAVAPAGNDRQVDPQGCHQDIARPGACKRSSLMAVN